MNKQLKTLFVLAFAMVMSVTSCLNENEDTNSGAAKLPSNVVSFADQVEAMKSSVVEIEAIQSSLTEMSDLQATASHFETCAAMIEEHIASIESGVTGVPAVVAAMNIQSKVAAATGALKVDLALLDVENAAELQSAVLSIENGVKSWLGKDFKSYFEVSSEAARLGSMINIVEEQSLSADAMMSDVEAGLRVGDATEDLKALIATVGNTSDALTKLNDKMVSLCTEVEGAYMSLFNAETDSKENLKTVNTKAGEAVKSSAVTLTELVARVVACENAIGVINTKLAKVEADVAELLDKIQSVTFLSDYSEEYAIAYYEMDDNKVSAPGKAYDGKNQRNPTGTIQLSYMVRPAAAAAAVTSNVISVVGYYANHIQTKAVDPSQFVNFEVQGVQLTNAERGIVTVTISHDLKDDFYYRQTGAKCALFIATGKTDVSSKFVELYPKDNSSTVYVEGIKINTDDFEIDEGQTKNLTATVNPSSATNKTVTWTSSNTEIATIDQYTGVLNAVKQGNVVITATTNGIDEWGDNLTASVNVKVNPSIRLGGPTYVEVGKTAELTVDFPPAMNIESKVWMSSDKTKATVDNGIVTGVAHSFNEYTGQYTPVTITCIVNGEITLTHEMDVTVLQPRQIRFAACGDEVTTISTKVDEPVYLEGTMLPDGVSGEFFRITYAADGADFGWINFDTGAITNPGNVGSIKVVATVRNQDDKKNYLKTSISRTIYVDVKPYYVASISFADVELEPGATATLAPTITSDTQGKTPTNATLSWASDNDAIATVDQNGVITAVSEGDVTITATATDGSNVVGTCKVSVVKPWTPFNVGDYVVRKSDGTIAFFSSATDAKNNGTVVGVVIYKGNPRVSDAKLPESCTHGIAVGIKELKGYVALSGEPTSGIYSMRKYVETYPEKGYASPVGISFSGSYYINDIGKKPYGYNNTLLYRDWINECLKPGITAPLLDQLDEFNVTLPNNVSSWYLPSFFELNLVAQQELSSVFTAVGGDAASNWNYWTLSEIEGNERTRFALINLSQKSPYYLRSKYNTSQVPYSRVFFAF